MTIGLRIKERRIDLGMTQPELAASCGWTDIRFSGKEYDNGQLRISRYERGIYEPSIDCIIKLSKALKVSVNYLISGNTKKDKLKKLDTNISM